MKLICWHAAGHRLRTWIPILILIQCGLIVVYISIVQHDKDKAEEVIMDSPLPRQLSATREQLRFNYSARGEWRKQEWKTRGDYSQIGKDSGEWKGYNADSGVLRQNRMLGKQAVENQNAEPAKESRGNNKHIGTRNIQNQRSVSDKNMDNKINEIASSMDSGKQRKSSKAISPSYQNQESHSNIQGLDEHKDGHGITIGIEFHKLSKQNHLRQQSIPRASAATVRSILQKSPKPNVDEVLNNNAQDPVQIDDAALDPSISRRPSKQQDWQLSRRSADANTSLLDAKEARTEHKEGMSGRYEGIGAQGDSLGWKEAASEENDGMRRKTDGIDEHGEGRSQGHIEDEDKKLRGEQRHEMNQLKDDASVQMEDRINNGQLEHIDNTVLQKRRIRIKDEIKAQAESQMELKFTTIWDDNLQDSHQNELSTGRLQESKIRSPTRFSSNTTNSFDVGFKSKLASLDGNVSVINRSNETTLWLYPNKSRAVNMFQAYDLNSPPTFYLKDDNKTYFTIHAQNLSCLEEGTASVFLRGAQAACICRPSWNGPHCSVPDAAMYTAALRYMHSLKPAVGGDGKGTTSHSESKVRRIIHAITFNVEWELLEARLYELRDLVDVYILVESNYTQYGDPKPLYLLERLRQGYLYEFHDKICYLLMDTFPEGGKENGWIVDQFARTYIGTHGLQRIKGIQPHDLFIYTDADEIPSREVLLFLKLHYGYPEPFGLALRWSVFGFFWKQYDLTRIMVGCSVNMLTRVFHNDVYKLRTASYRSDDVEAARSSEGGLTLVEWYFGDGGAHAGWHCSWCMPPDRVRIKLTSALNADFPRWGDYPDKRDLTYIRKLIKTGTWFDDKTTFNSLVNRESDAFLAPAFMLENFKHYGHLLDLRCVK